MASVVTVDVDGMLVRHVFLSFSRVADLLLSGMVLKKFLIDHNLHGMSFVNVGKFKFRRANLDLDSSKLPVRNSRSDTHVWVLRDMPPDMFLDLQVQKQTTCELELDCSSEDIVNPRDADKGGLNPGLSALWRDEEERRARRGDASTLVAPLSHDRLGVMKTDSELFYIRKLDKLLRAAQSTDRPGQTSDVGMQFIIVDLKVPNDVFALTKCGSYGAGTLTITKAEDEEYGLAVDNNRIFRRSCALGCSRAAAALRLLCSERRACCLCSAVREQILRGLAMSGGEVETERVPPGAAGPVEEPFQNPDVAAATAVVLQLLLCGQRRGVGEGRQVGEEEREC
ncbi:hypothetical protein HPB47_018008 [Ixodes persulcatus]|uniref:Uncharacterized protein n=1 Tax=Ixodes persulcatus TaxID=34615 RepID=A0AC60QLV9_IXOPE|nr:hypothetical protein HPB47_018008 [Ixodes persulcatus]